jgi:hypothetical protein
MKRIAFLLLACATVMMWPTAGSAQFGVCNSGEDFGCRPMGPGCAPADAAERGQRACEQECCSDVEDVDVHCESPTPECGSDWKVWADYSCSGTCNGGPCSTTYCFWDDDCCDMLCYYGYCESIPPG